MDRLNGKTALVVGGARGIGLKISERFAREGARVFVTSRHRADLDAALTAIGGGAQGAVADASDPAQIAAVVATVGAERDGLDILVINAGLAEPAELAQASGEHFDRTFGLNVRSPLLVAQSALPLMTAGGSIVLIGSIAGSIGTAGYGVYGASKAAVRSFARTWANELASRGIRVNVVSPGPIDTAMFAAVSDEFREAVTAMVPLGRLGRADEVASAALFLASDEASYVTGAELCVDGGMAQV